MNKNRMKLGIQPTGWTNDDFQWIGNDLPYQVILDQTKETGFEGGSTGHNYPAQLPSLLFALNSRKLQICATWAGTSFTLNEDPSIPFAEYQQQVDFLQKVGAKDVVVAELANAVVHDLTKSVLKDRPIFTEAQWFLLITSLNHAGRYASERGMTLSYHPHVGTGVMTIEETTRLLESTNPDDVGLCIDTAHLHFGGASQQDLEKLTDKYKNRIRHVHLKNCRGDILESAVQKNYSFYQAIQSGIFTVPGDPSGDLNLKPIVQTLKGNGYDRWMVIEAEQNPENAKIQPYANPLKAAETARAFLKQELGY